MTEPRLPSRPSLNVSARPSNCPSGVPPRRSCSPVGLSSCLSLSRTLSLLRPLASLAPALLAATALLAVGAQPAFVFAAAFAAILALPLVLPAHALALHQRPPKADAGAYEVKSLEFAADVTGQKATAVLRTVFANPTGRTLEIDYLAPLPRGASVVSAVLVEEGRELMGKVYVKEEAFRIYSETVAKMKDPALIEYAGQDTYRARIYPVPPNEARTLELTMSFLVPKERGVCALSV
ncbi:MAG: hypothetical protein LBR80_08040, partial [Deltaproteobacteria bacterium]|nr:hypothetical protein [Deltaproteobacteria bacterium]